MPAKKKSRTIKEIREGARRASLTWRQKKKSAGLHRVSLWVDEGLLNQMRGNGLVPVSVVFAPSSFQGTVPLHAYFPTKLKHDATCDETTPEEVI